MQADCFNSFRLVGGTALSLQLGHRLSVDIDLFTDALYGAIDFDAIDKYLKHEFEYVATSDYKLVGMGRSYYIGNSKDDCIKLDIFYTDSYIRPALESEGVRMADLEDITAMKIDVIARGGRMKDFWDLHFLLDLFSVEKMIALHEERYPHGHDESLIRKCLNDFAIADDEFEPVCLLGKHWELIKLDFVAALQS